VLIFDTNIWVSYSMIPNSRVATLVDELIEIESYAMSEMSFSELNDVMMRPKFNKYFSYEKRKSVLNKIAAKAKWFTPTETIHDCRDPKDNKFLELAAASRADFLITGDDDLLVLHPFRQTHILTLSAFAEQHLSK
tara:strand:- start:2418 stop:2825 length:408 start_codon:yes stop_codon:yes gene_type:complete